jgi:hypothetical protein
MNTNRQNNEKNLSISQIEQFQYAEIMEARIRYWQMKYDPNNKYLRKQQTRKAEPEIPRGTKIAKKVDAVFGYLASFFL